MSITTILIIITVVVSLYAWQNPITLDKLMMRPTRIAVHKEYYRFISSGFVHADYWHLGFNMISLYGMGMAVEGAFNNIFGETGKYFYLALYIIGIIVSDLPTFFKNRHNTAYASLGASGGVSSVVFAAIMVAPLASICLYFAICIPGFIFGGLYVLYSYYEAKRGGSRINHDAHLYGALFGIVFMILTVPQVVPFFFEQIKNFRPF